MSKILLVSPPYMKLSVPNYEVPKSLLKGCDYMNPGLLISSSILDKNNISNKIIKINNPNNIDEIKKYIENDTILVGISCTSAWEYLESLNIASNIKKVNNNIKVVLSGWQIKSIKDSVFKDSNDIDYLILGDVEYTIEKLYQKVIGNYNEDIISVIEKNNINNPNINIYPKIDFTLIDFSKYPNYQKYIPFVEESRNCPYNCNFCLNSCVIDKYQNVQLDIFIKNVLNVEKIYGINTNANLLAANFGVNVAKTKEKLNYLKTKNINWNIELHVDNNWEEYINDLKDAKVNKVSIGFESGSIKTLSSMNKTKDPKRYLLRLKTLLLELNKQNIKPSLNLLIDYKDTKESLEETLEFLNENKDLIKKVKGNFMFAFEGILNNIDYSYDPNIIINEYGNKIHTYPILPNDYNLNDLTYIINEIENGNYSNRILRKVKKR